MIAGSQNFTLMEGLTELCRSLRECQLCPVNWHSNEHVGRNCRWFSISIMPKGPEEYESYILNQFSKLLSRSCKQKLCHYISIQCQKWCRGRLCTYNCQRASTPSGFCPTFQLLLHLENRYPRQTKLLSMSTLSSKFSMYTWILCQFFIPPDAKKNKTPQRPDPRDFFQRCIA